MKKTTVADIDKANKVKTTERLKKYAEKTQKAAKR